LVQAGQTTGAFWIIWQSGQPVLHIHVGLGTFE
jgi:hypothetical protein